MGKKNACYIQCTTTPWHSKFKFTLHAIHNSKFHVVTFEDYKKYYRLTIPGIINLIQSDAMSGGNVSAAPCRCHENHSLTHRHSCDISLSQTTTRLKFNGSQFPFAPAPVWPARQCASASVIHLAATRHFSCCIGFSMVDHFSGTGVRIDQRGSNNLVHCIVWFARPQCRAPGTFTLLCF
jgi:hypothetical protein